MSALTSFVVVAVGFFDAAVIHRSANFLVEAPTLEMAKQVAEAAELHLKKQALSWLGKELPQLPGVIHIQITTGDVPSGAAYLDFSRPDVHVRRIELEGTPDQMLKKVVPHEITHVILGKHFRRRIALWANEGAASLSEDARAHEAYRRLFERMVQRKALIPLKKLLREDDYPRDLGSFYTQSLHLTRFLVELKDRATFLRFVEHASDKDWDSAVQLHYGYRDVAELETAWWMWEGALLAMRR